jgi:hypothetical protein
VVLQWSFVLLRVLARRWTSTSVSQASARNGSGSFSKHLTLVFDEFIFQLKGKPLSRIEWTLCGWN